jgi:hypothetical protein
LDIGIIALLLDAVENMIGYIEANAPRISKTPFKMENFLHKIMTLLINFVTQSKKNQKYCFDRIITSKILITQILAFPEEIKHLIIFIYNCTSQSARRRDNFIFEKYGIQLFKKIFKILILEHKKVEWLEEDKRRDEKHKKMEDENIMYKKTNKKQVRMIGDYHSDSENEYVGDDNSDPGTGSKKINEFKKKAHRSLRDKSEGAKSSRSSKRDTSPKSSKKTDGDPHSPTTQNDSPTKSKEGKKSK